MSLDVYLIIDNTQEFKRERILIREGGQTLEISQEEWNRRFPDRKPISIIEYQTSEVYWANITHNLGPMANAAGVYHHLWRPEELGISQAKQLIEPLTAGLELLKGDPDRFKTFNPPNGWGAYEGLVSFVEECLKACYLYPEATIQISR